MSTGHGHRAACAAADRPRHARCQRAVSQCELLVKAHPDARIYRLALAKALLRSGQAHQANSDATAAAADWRRAIAVVEAVAAPTGELVFVSAGCHALMSALAGMPGSQVSASEKDPELNHAMTLLRQAAATGYRDPNAYRTDNTLDPLRNRDDFRSLIMDLAMPVNPLAHE